MIVFDSDTADARRVNPLCPIHGTSRPDPIRPWALTWTDRQMLRTLRIDTEESASIQDVRRADERRFNRE